MKKYYDKKGEYELVYKSEASDSTSSDLLNLITFIILASGLIGVVILAIL